jgi:hypothetical protein
MTTDKGESSKSGTEGAWAKTPTASRGADTEGARGNTDFAGGWGVEVSGTWGIDAAGTWGGGEGWGGSSDGWGGGKTGDNTSTSGNEQKGKRKEKEDVEMRDSSPPRTNGSFKPISLSHTRLESDSLPPPPARNTPPPSTVASKPARPIPLPLPGKKKAQLFEDGNLTKLALQSVKKKEAEQVQENPNSLSAQGPKGRADLFSQVLKWVDISFPPFMLY